MSQPVEFEALVLSSGGLDSTVAIAEAVLLWGTKDVAAISFSYGQTHTEELNRAAAVAQYYGLAMHQLVELPRIFGGTESTLVAENELDQPEMSYEAIDESYGVSPTYVPYRNGNLLSVATAVALTHEASEVWAGMHAEDAHNWAYPDCTPEFLGAQANAIYIGSYHKVRLVTPHMWRMKSDIVKRGKQLAAPLHLTMSCYKGIEPACGTCPTCVGRINAFREAGFRDPIPYEIEIDWS